MNLVLVQAEAFKKILFLNNFRLGRKVVKIHPASPNVNTLHNHNKTSKPGY